MSGSQAMSREELLAEQSLFAMLNAKELSALAKVSRAKHLESILETSGRTV